MAVLLVTYDLHAPGRDYAPVHEYLRQFAYCKHLESVWLIDTQLSTAMVRDALMQRIDRNDTVFVVQLMNDWAAYNYRCADWLKSSNRTWQYAIAR